MIAILGAGLAGLTAAYELLRRGVPGSDIVVFEDEDRVGGLAQTRSHGAFRFDLGPHRWFTKSAEIDRLWQEVNAPDILHLDRLTRIWYRDRLLNYPLDPLNIVAGLGLGDSAGAVGSYLLQSVKNRLGASAPQNLEDAFVRQFGPALYHAFFKEYNQKLWGGEGCRELAPDWAKQRVRNLSLGRALLDAFGVRPSGVVSLVERFSYPTHGTGQTAERLAQEITAAGGRILCSARVTSVEHGGGRVRAITVERAGMQESHAADYCISSLPVDTLARALTPRLPCAARHAATGLRYRDLLLVVLFLEQERPMPDNWIYVQDPRVSFNRFMDMGSWNRDFSPAGTTSIVFEVTCHKGDAAWSLPDAAWVERVAAEFVQEFGMTQHKRILGGTVVRKSHAYPVYRLDYRKRLEAVKGALKEVENLQLIGRNGLFRYNNMDHAMASGVAAARNYLGGAIDLDAINSDAEYHEVKRAAS